MRSEKFKTVSVLDPALDIERMTIPEMREFNTTREWEKIAPFLKPGEHPTIYHLGECPHALWPWVMSAGDDEEQRFERAFRCCVERVQNVYQRDGVRIESWEAAPSSKPKPMPDEDLARFPHNEVAEIGRVCFEHSFLSMRIEGCFQLHALSVEQLAAKTFRPAESSRGDAQETSSAKPSASTGASQGTTGNASAMAAGGSA